ncbi:Erp protein C-terminus [Borreliella japonica]|uniref:Erp protein C-terminus n=1 Tax=Borreliella japonica TaxID=34095 RepID=A0A1G4QHT4_BORJA|nr:hypothetical protein [Borreliella japonica]SCW44170.1 Erp protein C-terminus [Borreliella japonica]
MKKKMVIICAVFAVIISCKNYAGGEDLKQNLEEQVKEIKQGVEIERKIKQGIEKQVEGFLEKKEGIISDDEIAKKLKEEEELKEKKENKQEDEEELMRGDEPNSHISEPALKTTRGSGGQQKEEQQQEEKEEQAKAKAEQERKEKEEQEEKQVKSKIKTLTKKIDEINRDIDSIKHKSWFVEDEKRLEVKATEVRDKVTGPIYDHFTDDTNQAIYYTWGLDEEEDSELAKLLKKLGETRHSLRNKLNEGNKAYILDGKSKEPNLKENVKVDEIESDLGKLKSELEEVKNYLENESNFETIKEYVSSSDDK